MKELFEYLIKHGVTEKLLEERQRVLDAIPECPVHGKCVPHALEWIEKAKASLSAPQDEGWVRIVEGGEMPEENKPVDVVAKFANNLMVCSDTAYWDGKKWVDHSNDLQLVDGFIKYWRNRPTFHPLTFNT